LPRPIIEDGDFETLAGYLIYKFSRIPDAEDSILLNSYKFTILKKIKTNLVLVKIENIKTED
jgi:CBS domain containing-hemolysin-like protein